MPKHNTSAKTIGCLDFIAVIDCECSRWVTCIAMARFHGKDPFRCSTFSSLYKNVQLQVTGTIKEMCLYDVVQLVGVLVQRLLTEIHGTMSTGMHLAKLKRLSPTYYHQPRLLCHKS